MKTYFQNPRKYLEKPKKKEYYNYIYRILKSQNAKKVFDIGTASGDFLFYLPKNIIGIGIDKSIALIKMAKKTRKKKNIIFEHADFLHKPKLKKIIQKYGKPDVVCMFGTLTVFSNFKLILKTLFFLKPKLIIINDWFNIYPVDVNCIYKAVKNVKKKQICTWNIASIQSISTFLKKNKKQFLFTPYKMKKILKKTNDPLISWHAKLNKEKITTNGLGIILRGFHLIIKNKRKNILRKDKTFKK